MGEQGFNEALIQPLREFFKDSMHLVKKCTKPDRKEFEAIAKATGVGFLIMGFIGFFVKLIHIPINNILVGSWGKGSTVRCGKRGSPQSRAKLRGNFGEEHWTGRINVAVDVIKLLANSLFILCIVVVSNLFGMPKVVFAHCVFVWFPSKRPPVVPVRKARREGFCHSRIRKYPESVSPVSNRTS